jgi:hypothetical protein
MMRRALLPPLLLLASVLATEAFAADPPRPRFERELGLRVLQHEAARELTRDRIGRPTGFEAYGRRFELALERNERLAFVTNARLPGVEALRGTLRNLPGSWVRITRTPAGLYGMFSDGRQIYVIEPAHELAGSVVTPLEAGGDQPVVYRLADTVLPIDGASCGTVTLADVARGGQSGAAQFNATVAELQIAAAGLPPTRQMEVAVVGDFEFSQLPFTGGLTPEQAIAARMNVVDGIFSEQVGVKLLFTLVTVFRDPADPFSATTVPSALLQELGAWRTASTEQRSRGLTHLLTGRDLDGTTVGIAYVGALCRTGPETQFGVGLSQVLNQQAAISPLIIAHELGHNFGASHDGETGSVCEATPRDFLMAPRINNVSTFSQCSLDTIAPRVAAASTGPNACVVPLNVPDADFDLPAASRRLRGASFEYAFTVRSIGATQVEGVTATITAPASLTLNSASAGGTACTIASNRATCTIGAMAPQANRAVTLNLTGQQAGTATVQFALSASNDAGAYNNSGSVAFGIDPSADLAVTLSAAPATLTTGSSTQLTATVRHVSGEAVPDARLTLTVPTGLTPTAVGTNALGCSLAAGAVTCTPVALAVGASQSVTVTLAADTSTGSRQVNAAVAATLGDPLTSDNNTAASVTVQAPPAAGGSGGGGGRLTPEELAALSALLLLSGYRNRRRPRLQASRAVRRA